MFILLEVVYTNYYENTSGKAQYKSDDWLVQSISYVERTIAEKVMLQFIVLHIYMYIACRHVKKLLRAKLFLAINTGFFALTLKLFVSAIVPTSTGK